jgi:hypothetical protein
LETFSIINLRAKGSSKGGEGVNKKYVFYTFVLIGDAV